jgi:hypothetical protein
LAVVLGLRNFSRIKTRNTEAIAMAKPPSLMIAIGLPGRHGEDDEDQLDREQDGNGKQDIVEEAICSIAERLIRDGPPMIRAVRLLARAYEDMAQAAMKKDHHALGEAAADACDAMRSVIAD